MKFVWNTQRNIRLVDAFLALETRDEAKRFLRDLMTENEIEEFGRRLEAAKLLTAGTPYESITSTTGLSSTTVARISKWLKGTLGGYGLVLKRIGEDSPAVNPEHHSHS